VPPLSQIASVLLAALAGFTLANRAVVALRPWPSEVGLAAKVEHLRADAGAYDVYVIGSSATYYGLRPRTLERTLSERGHQVRVFNLGVGGMGSYEQVHLTRWLLARARPALVCYEEPRFDPLLWYPEIKNPRYVHWHDVRTTLAALRGLRFVKAPPPYKAEAYAATWHGDWKVAVALEHLTLCGMQITALGDGPRSVGRLFGLGAPLAPSPAQLAAEAGWVDIAAEPDAGALRQNERFRAEAQAWDSKVAEIRAQNEQRVDLAATFDLQALAELEALFAAHGVPVVWYATPRATGDPTLATLAEAGRLRPYLAYNRPDLAPELFEAAVRWDPNHLDASGAERFSERFGRDLAAVLDAARAGG